MEVRTWESYLPGGSFSPTAAPEAGLLGERILTLSTRGKSFTGGAMVKNPSASAGDAVQSLGKEDPLQEEMASHSSILAWKIPCTEEPWNGVHGVTKVGHD